MLPDQLLAYPTYLIANKVADRRRLGHQLANEVEPLAFNLTKNERHSRYVSGWVAQTVDKAETHRISAAHDDDRDGRGGGHRRKRRVDCPICDDHRHPTAD
jgi:hypothetical protein